MRIKVGMSINDQQDLFANHTTFFLEKTFKIIL